MQTALRLGKKGIGKVEPNPAVGCVIVKNGEVIGRGWHKKFGAAHAEINALADCRSRGSNPKGGVMYVTLEPCCHYGKTPPCTKAIIEAGIRKVFIAAADVFAEVNGAGIRQLNENGIETEVGLCGRQARRLNAAFIKYVKTAKPWIILKWAQTIDGSLAHQDRELHRWVTNEKSRKDVHRLRRQVNGILVGIGTVLADNPLLTARPARKDRILTRVVLDSKLRIPVDCRLVQTADKTPLIVFTTAGGFEKKDKLTKLRQKGVEIIETSEDNQRCSLVDVTAELGEKGIDQLLVEGGASVTAEFLKKALADEAFIYIAPEIHGINSDANILQTTKALTEPVKMFDISTKKFGQDIRIQALFKQIR